jgi:putative transposase
MQHSPAKRFFKRLLAGLKYKPRCIITDGLRSYGTMHREVLPEVKHRTSCYLNNRGRYSAENSQLLCSSETSIPA